MRSITTFVMVLGLMCAMALSLSDTVFAASPVVTSPGGPAPISKGSANDENSIQAAQAALEGPLVKVTIATSRSEVTSEGGYGVFADLQNIDTVPLRLLDVETMLVVQPELAGDHNCIFAVNGFYPTEDAAKDAAKDVAKTSEERSQEIIIQPKEHYVAFWDITNRSLNSCDKKTDTASNKKDTTRSSVWSYFLDRISFVPGNYAFVVVGKAYRLTSDKAETKYHTYTDQVKLHVGLTQLDAMIASMIGGLFGYLVAALRKDGDFSRFTAPETGESFITRRTLRNLSAAFVILRNMISASLVSAAVTILLSRISDTQFPIKVSVADFWGALTIGFIAFFVGNKLIDRIVGLASNNTSTGTPPKNDLSVIFRSDGKAITTLDFGTVSTGSSKTVTVEVVNSGQSALVAPKAAVATGGSPEIAIQSDHLSSDNALNPGESRTIQLIFAPTTAEPASATLTVTGSNLTSGVNLLLSGKG